MSQNGAVFSAGNGRSNSHEIFICNYFGVLRQLVAVVRVFGTGYAIFTIKITLIDNLYNHPHPPPAGSRGRRMIMATARDSKSHEPGQVYEAAKSGKRLVLFDSGLSGNDDLLIMEQDETLEDIEKELREHHEVNRMDEDPFLSDINPWTLHILEPDEIQWLIEDYEME